MPVCLLLAISVQIADLDQSPHATLGLTGLRTPNACHAFFCSENGLMALQSDAIYLFNRDTRRLVRRVPFALTEGWLAGLDKSGTQFVIGKLQMNHDEFRLTTEVRNIKGDVLHRYVGAFAGFLPKGRLLLVNWTEALSFPRKPMPTKITVQRGHERIASVECTNLAIRVSPDGDELICLRDHTTAEILDAATLTKKSTFAIVETSADVKYSAQGIAGTDDILVTAGPDVWRYRRNGDVVWHMTGTYQCRIETHLTKSIGVACGFGKRLQILDLEHGKLIRALAVDANCKFKFTPDNLVATLEGRANGPRFFNPDTGTAVGDLLPVAPARSLRFRPGTHDLLSVSEQAFVWDVDKRRPRFQLDTTSFATGYSPDGARLHTLEGEALHWLDPSTGKKSRTIDLTRHDKRTGTPVGSLTLGDLGKSNDIAFIDKRESAWVVSEDGEKVRFKWLSREKKKRDVFMGMLTGRYEGFDVIRFRPDTSEVVVQTADGLTFYDLTSRVSRDCSLRMETVLAFRQNSMIFLDRNRLLLRLESEDLSTSFDTKLGLLDCRTLTLDYEIFNEFEVFDDVVFSADGKYLLCVGHKERHAPENPGAFKRTFDHGLLKIFDAKTGILVKEWSSRTNVKSVAVSDDSALVAIGMSDTTIRLFKLTNLISLPDA